MAGFRIAILQSRYFNRGLGALDAWAQFANDHQHMPWLQRSDWLERGKRPVRETAALLEDMVFAARKAIPDAFGDPSIPGSIAEALFAISQMTYWTRAWIFQELAFASKVRFRNGTRSITLDAVLAAMNACIVIYRACQIVAPQVWDQSMGRWKTTPLGEAAGMFGKGLNSLNMFHMCRALLEVRDAQNPAVAGPSLTFELLRTFSCFDSTDARDKVFALWGFVDPASLHSALLRPDYSLQTHEVYTRATQYLILDRKNLNVLEYRAESQLPGLKYIPSMSTSAIPIPHLPTWVPDWSHEVSTPAPHDGLPVESDRYSFSDVVRFSQDGMCLEVKGRADHVIGNLLTHDMFPFPVPDGAGKTHLDNLLWFVNDIVSRGQSVLCQYLCYSQANHKPNITDLSEQPLDILASLANGSMRIGDIWKGVGDGVYFLSLIRSLEPVIQLLFDRNASGQLPRLQEDDSAILAALRILSARADNFSNVDEEEEEQLRLAMQLSTENAHSSPITSISGEENEEEEDEEELLRRAVQLSIGETDPVTVELPPENPMGEAEHLREAIILSLGLEPPATKPDITEADLCSFQWLADLLSALSAPGVPLHTTILQAFSAILSVSMVELADKEQQKRTRPGKDPWVVMWNTGSPWRFFTTEEGKLGYYSAFIDPLPGDRLCWLAAHSFPFLLREGEDGVYQLVGKCEIPEREGERVRDMEVGDMEWFRIV